MALRVGLHAVHTKYAHRWFAAVHLHSPQTAPTTESPVTGEPRLGTGYTEAVEALTARPEFTRRVFHLKLPAGTDPLRDGLRLTVQLFSKDGAGLGKSVAEAGVGRDTLHCVGRVDLGPDTIGRLKCGGRLPLSVVLEEGMGRVELDVLLVDPAAAGAEGGAGAPQFGPKCRLSVFVSHAGGLPAKGGDPFVVLKTVREAASRASSKTMTSTSAAAGDRAVWEQTLEVDFLEAELSSERLLVALVDSKSDKLVGKAAIPTRGLFPGVHHNLKLAMDGTKKKVVLFLTVYLNHAVPLERLWLNTVPRLTKVAVTMQKGSLVQLHRSLQGLEESAAEAQGNQAVLVGVWRVLDIFMGALPKESLDEVWTPSDTETEASILAALAGQKYEGVEITKSVQPLLGATRAGLWTEDHSIFLTADFTQLAKPVLAVELHRLEHLGEKPGGKQTLVGYCMMEMKGLLDGGEAVQNIEAVEIQHDKNCARKLEGSMNFDLVIQGPDQYKAALHNAAADPSVGEAGGAPGSLSSLLVRDLYHEHTVCHKVLHRLEKAQDKTDRFSAQSQQLDKKVDDLRADLADMHRLLEEERRAHRDLPGIEGWEAMSKETLYGKVRQVLSLHSMEARKNQELVHQLQKLHGDLVDAESISEAYTNLQEAHVEQSKQLSEFESDSQRLHDSLEALQNQEKVIKHLEKMLGGHMGVKKRLVAVEDDLAGANEEIRALKALKNTEELDNLRAELAGSEQSKTFVDSKVKDLESKLLAVTLRAEKADIKASTARNEMIDVTKKYAKEISSLKARLAEKEAQLMGGFGSLSKLALGEMSQAGGSLHARPAPALPPGPGSRAGSRAGSRPGSRPSSGRRTLEPLPPKSVT